MKRLFRVFALAVCLCLVVGLLITPAQGAYEAHVYDVGTPKRTYNSDNTVTILYDVLSPMMGVTDVSDPENPVFISLKDSVTFSQTIDFVETKEWTYGMSVYNYYDNGRYVGEYQTLSGVSVYSTYLSDSLGGDDLLSNYPFEDLSALYNSIWFDGQMYEFQVNACYYANGSLAGYYAGNPDLMQYYSGTTAFKKYDENGNQLLDNGLNFCIVQNAYSTQIYTPYDFWIRSPENDILEFGNCEITTEFAPEHYALNLAIAPFTIDNNVSTLFDLYDIKTGYGYEVIFDFDMSITWGGGLPEVPLNFYFTFFDGDYNIVLSSYEEFASTLTVGQERIRLTVPEGSRYVRVNIAPSADIDVSETTELNISLNSFTISSILTASENSDLMDAEQNNQVNDKLEDILGAITGDGGVDTGVSDFSGANDTLQDAMQSAGSAMNSGSDSVSDIANSSVMAGTLASLGSGLAVAFSDEFMVNLCGMSFNPFTLWVTVIGGFSLIALMVAYIFRKRGGS